VTNEIRNLTVDALGARMTKQLCELSDEEMNAVSGGVFTEVHHNPQYKEPTVLLDDGLNIRTTGVGYSNVGYDSPFTPIA
jgi:bacteriocin-like protein